MKVIGVSSAAISNGTKFSLARSQEALVTAQKEVSTGRLADVGLSLGSDIGEAISLRADVTRISQVRDTNNTVQTRLELSQAALQNVVDGAQNFIDQLLASRNSATGAGIVSDLGEANRQALTDALNTNVNGAQVFAGLNSDVRPITKYEGGAGETAIDAAFLAEFGFTQTDPAVENITPTQLESFLTGNFAAEFDATEWSNNWSTASDELISNRISLTETLDSSVSANEAVFRNLASIYTAAANIGTEGLNDTTFQSLVDTLVEQTAAAVQDVSVLQSRLGIVEQRVEESSTRLDLQVNILTGRIGELEEVDAFEAGTRLTSILTEIEVSYALTARIQNLSILNFL